MNRLILLLAFSVVSCYPYRQKIEVHDIQKECDFSIFNGLEPDMEEDVFFSVLGQPNEWYYGKEEEGRHCPIYYFKEYKLKGCWDGSYPKIGVIEFIPYNNIPYTLDQFLSDPQKYGIHTNTKRLKICSNGIWWFEVYLDNSRIERIQYWCFKRGKPVS